MKIIPSKQTVLLREQRAKVYCFSEMRAGGFSFNQLRMQKECADGNMIEKAGNAKNPLLPSSVRS